jgi:cytochrome c oxidase subunit 3
MLFSGFFWAFFHSSLSPSFELGAVWPPVGIHGVNPWSIPLLGSTVLLASGFFLTWGHHAFITGSKSNALIGLILTILLGIFFLFLQYNEYYNSEFTIADSVYSTVFYSTTSLHAFHVTIGVIFLTVSLYRIFSDSFTCEHHIGLETSIYYWHMVDIVWLALFIIFYIWGY